VEVELDLKRLTELQQLLGTELPEIVATLLDELTSALSRIDAGDLDAVALAAHAARNSALMIDARQILGYLEALEVSARHGEPGAASAANDRLRASWPALRTCLEQIAQ
jgi:hypothetical protein